MNSNRQLLEASQGYQFTAQNDTYSHFLLCKICNKLMIEPSRLYPCGHTFCKSCIIQHNKNISQAPQTSRQNRCFIPFPQCGKYYITLQPDLLAASLINDLQVKCLNEGCPWKGPLQRFKISHKNLCKLQQGGLSAWLDDFNQGVKSIKKIRNERKNTTFIEIDENDQLEVLQQNPNKKILKPIQTNETIQNLIVTSKALIGQKDSVCIENSFKVNESQKIREDKQSIKQKKFLLGLNKNKVGDQRKHQKKQMSSNIVNLDEDCFQRKSSSKILILSNIESKQSPINLDDCLDAKQTLGEKINVSNNDFTNQQKKTTQTLKEMKQNYTGLKMINSYKKKSQKIAQNPHNMNLTRSQPLIKDQDSYQNLF